MRSTAFLRSNLQDYINLMGEVIFPNLLFEETDIDFGCILNDTECSRYVSVTNTSRLSVSYQWYFLLTRRPDSPGKTVSRHPHNMHKHSLMHTHTHTHPPTHTHTHPPKHTHPGTHSYTPTPPTPTPTFQ